MNLLLVVAAVAAIGSYALGGAQVLLASVHAAGQARVARLESVADRHARIALAAELGQAERAAVAGGLPYGPLPPLPAMATTPVCDTAAPCGLAASATFAVDGQTAGAQAATASVLAPNVEAADGVWERRVAVTMTVRIVEADTGNVLHVRPQRVKVRLWAPGNAEVDEGQDGAARWNRVAAGAAENEGCAADGSGCDSDRVQPADPTTLDGQAQCVQGAGSGTCAPGEVRPAESKANVTWSNAQAAASGAGL